MTWKVLHVIMVRLTTWETHSVSQALLRMFGLNGWLSQRLAESMWGSCTGHLGEKLFFAPEVARFAHIREVQVLEKFQGRGVGRKLVDHAIARLRTHAVTDVFLSTAETNDAAKHLYESVGFREFRRQIQYRLALDDTH